MVIGGITQSSTGDSSEGETTFANSIGANLVFPYPRSGLVTGLPSGLANVATQGAGMPTSATAAVVAGILNAAAQTPSGQSINIFAFSGGAQAFNSALSYLPSSVTSRINNVTYLSPGMFGEANTGNGNAALVTGNGTRDDIADTFMDFSDLNGLTINTGCGHDANCEFMQQTQFLSSRAGSRCSQPVTFSGGRFHGGGGGSAGFGASFGQIQGFFWSMLTNSLSTEVVTHTINYHPGPSLEP